MLARHGRLLVICLSLLWTTAHATERAYIGNFLDGTVSVIDTTTNSVMATIPLGIPGYSPVSVDVNAAGTRVYGSMSRSLGLLAASTQGVGNARTPR